MMASDDDSVLPWICDPFPVLYTAAFFPKTGLITSFFCMVSRQQQQQQFSDETRPLIYPINEDNTRAVLELRWFIRNSLSVVGYYALTLMSRTVGVIACGHLVSKSSVKCIDKHVA